MDSVDTREQGQILLQAERLEGKPSRGPLLVRVPALSVASGEVVAVLGPNGVGKSTMLRLLTGDLLASRGTVSYNGVRVGSDHVWRKQAGVVPQRNNLDTNLRVAELVTYHLRFFGWRRGRAAQRTAEVLQALKIAHLSNRWIRELSGGEQRRVAIARALSHRPSVVFLDELSAGLDIDTKQEVWAVLNKMRFSEGVAIVFASHDLQEVEALANRIVFVRDGTPIVDCTVEEFRNSYGRFTVVDVVTDDHSAAAAVLPDDVGATEITFVPPAVMRVWYRADCSAAATETVAALASLGIQTLKADTKLPSLEVAYLRCSMEEMAIRGD